MRDIAEGPPLSFRKLLMTVNTNPTTTSTPIGMPTTTNIGSKTNTAAIPILDRNRHDSETPSSAIA